MVQGQMRSAVPGSRGSQSVPLAVGNLTRPRFSYSLQNLFQCQNLRFRDEHTGDPMSLRVVPICARMVNHRLPLHVQFKSETGNALLGPKVHRRRTYAFDDKRGLPGIVKFLAFFVDVGRRFHPGKMPEFLSKVTGNIYLQGGSMDSSPAVQKGELSRASPQTATPPQSGMTRKRRFPEASAKNGRRGITTSCGERGRTAPITGGIRRTVSTKKVRSTNIYEQ
jgi:hypothetical protein